MLMSPVNECKIIILMSWKKRPQSLAGQPKAVLEECDLGVDGETVS